LKQADYWAKTGLPFIYTWAAADEPHMLYASIAVYGGSFMDYTLLGQLITWVGLDYADSLAGLVRASAASDATQTSGTLPWKKIAQGVVHNVVLQQEKTGEHAGQWPDWRELRTNRVIANSWYKNDPKPGLSLRRWAGKDFDPSTVIVHTQAKDIRVTSD